MWYPGLDPEVGEKTLAEKPGKSEESLWFHE